MVKTHKAYLFTIHATLTLLLILQPVSSSSSQHYIKNSSHKDDTHKEELSSKLVFDIKVHGFLLWASMGFLMPVGITAIRLSNREECGRRLKIIFYVHVILQMLAVLLATIGAVMSIKNLNNSFNNIHQRIGIGLYGMIWLQVLIALVRPQRGSRRRSMWFFMHWMVGTSVSLLGILNVYSGLQAYHEKTSRSIKLWNIIFTAEIVFFSFLYLFQDKLNYIQNQSVILGNQLGQKELQIVSC